MSRYVWITGAQRADIEALAKADRQQALEYDERDERERRSETLRVERETAEGKAYVYPPNRSGYGDHAKSRRQRARRLEELLAEVDDAAGRV